MKTHTHLDEPRAVVESASPRCKATLQWDKVPSVTCGGAPYFFNSVAPYNDRRTVIWDRFEEKWSVKGPQTLEHQRGKLYGYFDTVRKAKQFVEDGNAV